MKKHTPWLTALATAGLLAALGTAHAQTSTTPKRSPATNVQPATNTAVPTEAAPAAAAPAGDTHVHKFFQAWGRGMDKAGNAVDKAMPKPDHRWPGTATGPQDTR